MLQHLPSHLHKTHQLVHAEFITDHENGNGIFDLYKIRDCHKIWENPLLKACVSGLLTFEDFRFIFSQYYLYSKNFTRLLAAFMVNCESDIYRSKLSENLWEEGGGSDIEKRHAEIFRRFLVDHLYLNPLENIVFEPFTQDFFQQYLDMCLNYSSLEAAAALSLGTESIVPKLYQIFRQGLRAIGLQNKSLHFFDLHIQCDDDHAKTLEDILLSYKDEANWLHLCKAAIIRALDLRDVFFENIYKHISYKKNLDELSKSVTQQPAGIHNNFDFENLRSTTSFSGNLLYKNQQKEGKINFFVERIPFPSYVLDPRLVEIPSGHTNEQHNHAHETLFLILEGCGNVIIGENTVHVKPGDIVFIPRWITHQTLNTGSVNLRYFAVTDYGFTKNFPENTDIVYRNILEK
ncbi:MAG TPA: iron-containing redox enzyme family protein [Gammaproteobacteria bacterium]|nr:iron-containing redox enzyme family protein [Gammaproteobacteria bacterium]